MRRGLFAGIIIAGLILLNGFLSEARAELWVLLGKSDEGIHYYNKEAKKISDNNVRVWGKIVYNEEGKRETKKFLIEIGKYNGEMISHSLTWFEFDCKAAKEKALMKIIYDINGKRVAISPKEITDWEAITPKSFYDDLYKLVCK